LIPVLSWIILKGKCRNCGAAISFTYMLVELITGALFLISAVYFALPEAIVTALLYAVLAAIFFIDIKHLIIPDSLNIAIIVLALVMFFIRPDFKFPEYLTGALIISAPLLIIAIITKRGVGGGDVKLFFALGLFLGWKLTLLTAFLSFVSGGLIAAVLIAAKKAGRKTELPLGPPVCAAAVIATLFGDMLIDRYISLLA
jgi:prepilin signal peptidase PulO-like enzyme (type II secretory pathway)